MRKIQNQFLLVSFQLISVIIFTFHFLVFQPWQTKRMATASWVTALDKKEHKNWVMVGCALNIAKNGITQLIQGKMETWYQSLISSPSLQSLPACTCALGSPKCVTCVTWETELKRHHKSSRPKICWDNSDRTRWGSPTGAWEIAKIFMPTLGRRRTHVVDADTTDIGGLLNLLEWCPFINPPVRRAVLSSARDQCRNHWAHAPKQELQDADVNTIFGHLNNLLSDPVFNADSAAQQSSKDLQHLFHHGLVTVRDSEVEALHLLRQSLVADLTKYRDDLADVKDKVVRLDTDTKKVSEAVQKDVSEVKEQGDLCREEIAKLRQQLDTEVKEVETHLNEKISKIVNTVEDFNQLIAERDDLQGAFHLISDDVELVRSGIQNVALELATTKSQVDNLEINLASVKCEVKGVANKVATNKNTISDLQKDVMEVKEEVKTLKAKPPDEHNSDDSDDNDALCTAPSRLTAFTGREAALQWLEQNLASDQSFESCPGTPCCTKAICGLGGCGKTSLAAEFSWRYMNRFPGGVFWINGESDENICKSVVENLALLNIPASTSENVDDTLNRFLALLSKKKRPWLLVVDNADELEDRTCPTGVKKICKGPWQKNGNTFKHGHILLTTRRSANDTKTFLKLSFEDSLELQCFSEGEGALFLKQRTDLKGECLDPDAILLAKELGSLPLALEQAAAYISALPRTCSFKAYLEKYRAVKVRLLEQQPATALSVEAQHRLSVHTTWEMNVEFVSEKSPAAATMMRIAAFLESENIPIAFINPGFPELGVRCAIDVDAILKVLTSYSLFSVDQKRRVFSVHKLVQEVVRESLTTAAERIEILLAATRVLHFAFVANNERDTAVAILLNFRRLKNHMEEASKVLKEDGLHALLTTKIVELWVSVEDFFNYHNISLFRRAHDLDVKMKTELGPGRSRSDRQTVPFNDDLLRSRKCKGCAKTFFHMGYFLCALELYDQALGLSPNDAKLLSNKAAACVKLSEQSSVEKRKTFLEQALQASQNAIAADRSWVKGYYWKAVCLAHLGKRGPSLAAAAVAKHLFPSQCAKIPAVVDRFGSYDAQIITTIQDLLCATEMKKSRNVVMVVKAGRYELPSPLKIPKNAVMVGLDEVQITCFKGVPLQLDETVHMENISL